MTLRAMTGEADTETGETDPDRSLLDRLEALSAALENLSTTENGNSVEAVLQTLSRMERRDLHAIAAIDTFAIALKSLSQHLAHVRQSVQVGNAENGTRLDELAARLGQMETRLNASQSGGPSVDVTPMAAALDSIGQRLAGLESKLDSLPARQDHGPFDTDAFATALAAITDRLVRVEAKVDSVGQRLSRVEGGLGQDRPLPAAENIPDLLDMVGGTDYAPAMVEETMTESTVPAIHAEGNQRVDILLDQVFRSLAR